LRFFNFVSAVFPKKKNGRASF